MKIVFVFGYIPYGFWNKIDEIDYDVTNRATMTRYAVMIALKLCESFSTCKAAYMVYKWMNCWKKYWNQKHKQISLL